LVLAKGHARATVGEGDPMLGQMNGRAAVTLKFYKFMFWSDIPVYFVLLKNYILQPLDGGID
jgi:hypothetical protein